MNQVYSTKDRSTLIITNADTTHALTFRHDRERKTIEVLSIKDNRKEVIFTLNTNEAIKAISDFLNDHGHKTI